MKVERRDSISFVRAAPVHALRRFLAGLPHDAEVSVSVDRPPSPTPTDRGAVTIHAVWTDALAGGDSDE